MEHLKKLSTPAFYLPTKTELNYLTEKYLLEFMKMFGTLCESREIYLFQTTCEDSLFESVTLITTLAPVRL